MIILDLKLLPCLIISAIFFYRSGLGSHYGTLSGVIWLRSAMIILDLKLLPCLIISAIFFYRSGLGSHYGTLSGAIW